MQLIVFILFYCFVKPLSYLPFSILYGISDALYFVIYKIIGYRKKVVRNNLIQSFPQKSIAEIIAIEKKYYHNLCDWIVETVKMFSMSKATLEQRCKWIPNETWEQLNQEGRNIIIAGAHFNNFEWGAQLIGLHSKQPLVGLYTPISNPYFNKFILKNRSRWGLIIVAGKDFSDYTKTLQTAVNIGFVGDQCPRRGSKMYWTNFLNQETAVLTGIERYATKLNARVVFMYPYKIKRGVYEMRVKYICDEPQLAHPFSITESHTRYLESIIEEQPEAWMWSHKRWKFKKSDIIN